MEDVGFNATGVELFWIFTTGVCLVLMVTFFLETRSDKTFNELHGINGSAKIVAQSAVWRQGFKVVATANLFIPAILSGLYDGILPEGWRSLQLICLSTVPVILLVINVVDRLERYALIDYFQNLTNAERRQETENQIEVADSIQEAKEDIEHNNR